MQWLIGVALGVTASLACTLVISLYLHRGLTHYALRPTRVGDELAQATLFALTPIRPKEWVAAHRWHHSHVDGPRDVHSPFQEQFLSVLLNSSGLYRRWCRQHPGEIEQLARDVKSRGWFRLPRYTGTVITFCAIWMLTSLGAAVVAVLIWYGAMAFMLGVINALGHWPNRSNPGEGCDLPKLVLFTWGESLHATHHRHPRQLNLGADKRAIDTGFVAAAIFSRVGLISLARDPSVATAGYSEQSGD